MTFSPVSNLDSGPVKPAFLPSFKGASRDDQPSTSEEIGPQSPSVARAGKKSAKRAENDPAAKLQADLAILYGQDTWNGQPAPTKDYSLPPIPTQNLPNKDDFDLPQGDIRNIKATMFVLLRNLADKRAKHDKPIEGTFDLTFELKGHEAKVIKVESRSGDTSAATELASSLIGKSVRLQANVENPTQKVYPFLLNGK